LRSSSQFLKGDALAKPNFQFQKRQKELEKKKKQEEKRLAEVRERQTRNTPIGTSRSGNTRS
jgi:hypothetical protein